MDFLVVVGIAVAIAFVVYRGHKRRGDLRRLALHGRPVAGRITTLSRRTTKSGRRYVVGYEYRVDGRVFTGSAMISRTEHDALAKGGPIALAYLPQDPRIAAPEFRLPGAGGGRE